MKKIINIILRLVFSLLTVGVAYFMLESTVRISTNDFYGVVENSLAKNLKGQQKKAVEDALWIAKRFGMEEKVFSSVSKKYHYDLSYHGLYSLGATYQENGELTAKNLNLANSNSIEKGINHYPLYDINQNLKDNKKQVDKNINILHYFMLAIAVILLIGILLILLDRYSAAIFLLIGTIAGYVGINYLANTLTKQLHDQLTGSWQMSTSMGLQITLIAGIVLTVLWLVAVKLTREKK